MTPDNVIIRTKKLAAGYGGERILENVTLEIPRGVFMPFIGPNGSGKTTLLRTILGLLPPLAGELKTPFQNAPAGYVPQHKSIDPLFPLTVQEILEIGLYPRLGWWKHPELSDKKKIREVIDELALGPHADKNYRDLSGGTQQKVMIGRALVSGAEVFILDEPTSQLDEPSEREVFQHLARFVREENKTVLMAHHGLNRRMLPFAEISCEVSQGRVRLVRTTELEKREPCS